MRRWAWQRAVTRSVAGLAVRLAAALLWLAPVVLELAPADAEDALPLPRFASLDSSEVNLRAGPGEDYPILIGSQRRGLPVEIIQEFGTWRRIRDRDGTVADAAPGVELLDDLDRQAPALIDEQDG